MLDFEWCSVGIWEGDHGFWRSFDGGGGGGGGGVWEVGW